MRATAVLHKFFSSKSVRLKHSVSQSGYSSDYLVLYRKTYSAVSKVHVRFFSSTPDDQTKNSDVKMSAQAFKALQENDEKLDKKADDQGDKDKSVVNTMKKYMLMRRDRTKRYTDNNTITAVRAMQEYILKPSDLKDLAQHKIRSPYQDSKGHLLVYLENDVINKAKEVHGTRENLEREQKRIARLKDKQQRYLDGAAASSEDETLRGELKKNFLTSGSGRVVAVAVVSNALICGFKCTCWLYTGSASMFSETLHSFADMCNQMLLLWGVYQSTKMADADHPYGFGNMRYIVSLISGVGIFCIGCGASVYHGVTSMLVGGGVLDNITTVGTFGVLIGSALVESASLIVAIDETRHNAARQGMSFWKYVKMGQDPSTNVVLLEDSCAVLGVGIAGAALCAAHYLQNPLYDYVGSIVIGGLLGMVATFLVRSNVDMLIGHSIPQDDLTELKEYLEDDAVIRGVYDIKATQIGYSELKFKAEIDFDGREVTRVYLEKNDLEKIREELKSIETPKQLEMFLLNHGEAIIDTLGSQVDRLEADLKKKNKNLRHIDLEVL